jgi:hypothetical protein
MIKTRFAGTAAVFTFGLAALGGTVVAIAAPANAAPSASGTASASNTSTTPDRHPIESRPRTEPPPAPRDNIDRQIIDRGIANFVHDTHDPITTAPTS